MDKKNLLRIFYFILSFPFFCVFLSFYVFRRNVRDGLHTSRMQMCRVGIPSKDRALIGYLVAGEDHRFYSHFGFDPIAICRAIFKMLNCNRLEGASTIEQQYVRTCTKKYKISVLRKLDEIVIASFLSVLEDKDSVAYSYLNVAYYGSGIDGVNSAEYTLKCFYGSGDCFIPIEAFIISLLKNPAPLNRNIFWDGRHRLRALHIKKRYDFLAGNEQYFASNYPS